MTGIFNRGHGEKMISELLVGHHKIHIAPMTEEISVSMGAVLYKSGLTFDSLYKIADGGVHDSKLNKGSSYTFQS